MDTRPVAPSAPSIEPRYTVLRSIAAALIALLISFAVKSVARYEGWPHSQSIAFAAFLFCNPVLMPIAMRRPRSWASRLGMGFLFAIVGGLIHLFLIEPWWMVGL